MSKSDQTRPWGLLASLAIMITMPFAAQGTTFELDLMFPRNETYAPQALMPVVFAMQNPALVATMGGYAIDWALARNNNYSAPGAFSDGLLESSAYTPFTPNQPYYFTRSINTLAYPDSSWTLSWSVTANNCTPIKAGYDPYHRQYNGSVTFATKMGAQVPDLVAATGPGACNSATGFAFNVLSVTTGLCASLGPYESGSANPCGASLNATGASSILTEATSYACSYLQRPLNPNVTCPPLFPDSSAPDRYKASSYVYVWALLLAVAVVLNAPC